jgi:8-hydroxy-5-deazaflavin:NADPH oxidoreductase
MNIGIIGAGNIGGTLARRFAAVGHSVKIANSRGPETLKDLAAETGAKPVTVRDAVRDVQVIIVSIPEGKIPTLPPGLLAHVGSGVAVVDTGNYYPRQRDGRIAGIEEGLTESRWVEQQLGHRVVKAFNVIYAEHLLKRGKPRGAPGRIALPVAGDDPKAKALVMQLVDEIGFDPVDAGDLDHSWRQQPGTPAYVRDFDADGVRSALAAAKPERTSGWRATDKSPGTFDAPA